MPKTAARLADEIQGIWDAADRENRGLTADERQYLEGLVDEATSQHNIEKKIREIGGRGVSFVSVTDPNWSPTGGGPGDVFVASKGYQQIQDPAGRGQQWSTGPVEVAKGMPHTLLKGTLLETAGGAGPGGGLVPPQYAPGIVDKLFEPLGVADVFGQSTVNTSQRATSLRAPPRTRRRVWPRPPPSPSRRSATRRRRRRFGRSPRCSRSPTRCSRTHPQSRAT